MPSSTSSSEDLRVPARPTGGALLAGLVLFLGAMTGWELYWRGEGLLPDVPDDASLWSLTRSRIGPSDTVFVGSSRAQLGLVPEAWSEVMGGPEPIQLAIFNSHPWPILEHLAQDEDFHGTVIVDVAPENFMKGLRGGAKLRKITEYLKHYRTFDASPSERLEALLKVRLASLFVWRLPALAPKALYETLAKDARPTSAQHITRWDRCRWINPASDPKKLAAAGRRTAAGFEQFMKGRWAKKARPTLREAKAIMDGIAASVERLTARGGRVVFVAMPLGKRLSRAQERAYPRQTHFDRLGPETGALALHHRDHPELKRFVPVDESHLSRADAIAFTTALATLVKAKLAE